MSYKITNQRTFTWRGATYHAVQLDPASTDDVTDDYLKLGDGWRVHAPTTRERVELAGIPEPWDYALPQDWYDVHAGELKLRGGWAIWAYPAGNLFGGPRFADEIDKLAAQTCAAMILESTPEPEPAA
jgi:hypothetical protein